MVQVTGIVRVKINGKLHRTKQGAVLNFGGKTRTVQKGHSVYGFSEEVAESVVTITIAHASDTDIEELKDLVDAVVLFETDTGKTYQVNGAFVSTPPELTGGEGDLTLEITGQPAREL
jgi:molybdopterin synthase catalytic subunit